MYRMTDLNLSGKRVLIRQDLNVPLEDGEVSSDLRIQASLPTIRTALQAGAAVILMSHLGRAVEGQRDPALSLAPVARSLAAHLGLAVRLADDWLAGIEIAPGEVVLCENVRFEVGEKANDPVLAEKMASLCDLYVMDAFGTAHRAQASTHGVALKAAQACAGPLLCAEIDALGKALDNPARPMLAIVGGSKVSTKLTVLEALSSRVDQLVVGGGIANTFIAAAGHAVGASLYEVDLVDEAVRLIASAHQAGADIPIPTDVVVAKTFCKDAAARTIPVDQVAEDDMILDIGPDTAARLAKRIMLAGTVLWNGPVGVFEFESFRNGTQVIGQAIADSKAFSIAGGGDTLAAVDLFGLTDRISYISTGGGAFLEVLEGKTLPAIEVLEQAACQQDA